MESILTSTTFDIDGYKVVQNLGVVRGVVVRAPTITQGIFGGLKKIIGGHIGSYTEMCEQARQQAFEEMVKHAREQGANAIVGVRYDASEVALGATEVLCYGTGVKVTHA